VAGKERNNRCSSQSNYLPSPSYSKGKDFSSANPLVTRNDLTKNDLLRRVRTKGRLLVILFFLSLSFAWLLSCSRHKAKEPFLLEEGRGWKGKFSLGDPGEEVVRLLGKTGKQQEDKNWRYCDYDFAEIAVDLKTGKIASILLRKRWKTASGIFAGDPVEKILSTYGGIPYRLPILAYPKKGVSFALAPGEVTDANGSKRPGWAAIWVRIYKPQR
jgi:hypothetical protein